MAGLNATDCTIALTGDSIITRRIGHLVDRDKRFAELRSVLNGADATMTNLEVITPDDDAAATPLPPVPSQYQYLSPLAGILMRARPFVLDELDDFGIDLFATASNHSFDYGRPGMLSTANALRDRGLPFAGMGRTLAEARRPAYAETMAGRVGLVAANTSIAPGSEAGPASPIHPGRPGINPLHLRWVYGATAEQVDRLRELSDELGIEEMKSTWLDRSDPGWEAQPYYRFMHMPFETVEDESEIGVRFEPLENDRHAYLESIAESAANSDWTVASLHSHQAPDGDRNAAGTPAFLQAFARECIDAGADVFVVTGPHVLRGMEIYRDRPIFHSLGNLFYQTETIEQLPKESFDYYGVDDPTDTTELFRSRYFDDDGSPAGSLARDEYWETIVPVCRFENDGIKSIQLYPCVLGQNRKLPQRGTPKIATGKTATSILDRFEDLSRPYDIKLTIDDGVGSVVC
jgi:hypothetical protein